MLTWSLLEISPRVHCLPALCKTSYGVFVPRDNMMSGDERIKEGEEGKQTVAIVHLGTSVDKIIFLAILPLKEKECLIDKIEMP